MKVRTHSSFHGWRTPRPQEPSTQVPEGHQRSPCPARRCAQVFCAKIQGAWRAILRSCTLHAYAKNSRGQIRQSFSQAGRCPVSLAGHSGGGGSETPLRTVLSGRGFQAWCPYSLYRTSSSFFSPGRRRLSQINSSRPPSRPLTAEEVA